MMDDIYALLKAIRLDLSNQSLAVAEQLYSQNTAHHTRVSLPFSPETAFETFIVYCFKRLKNSTLQNSETESPLASIITEQTNAFQLKCFQFYVKCGYDPRYICPRSGMTALHYACGRDNVKMVEELIRFQCPLVANTNLETPLHYASFSSSLPIVSDQDYRFYFSFENAKKFNNGGDEPDRSDDNDCLCALLSYLRRMITDAAIHWQKSKGRPLDKDEEESLERGERLVAYYAQIEKGDKWGVGPYIIIDPHLVRSLMAKELEAKAMSGGENNDIKKAPDTTRATVYDKWKKSGVYSHPLSKRFSDFFRCSGEGTIKELKSDDGYRERYEYYFKTETCGTVLEMAVQRLNLRHVRTLLSFEAAEKAVGSRDATPSAVHLSSSLPPFASAFMKSLLSCTTLDASARTESGGFYLADLVLRAASGFGNPALSEKVFEITRLFVENGSPISIEESPSLKYFKLFAGHLTTVHNRRLPIPSQTIARCAERALDCGRYSDVAEYLEMDPRVVDLIFIANNTPKKFTSLLMSAIGWKNDESVKFMLDHGASVSIPVCCGKPPVIYDGSGQGNSYSCYSYSSSSSSQSPRTAPDEPILPLPYAIACKAPTAIVQRLLDAGASLTCEGHVITTDNDDGGRKTDKQQKEAKAQQQKATRPTKTTQGKKEVSEYGFFGKKADEAVCCGCDKKAVIKVQVLSSPLAEALFCAHANLPFTRDAMPNDVFQFTPTRHWIAKDFKPSKNIAVIKLLLKEGANPDENEDDFRSVRPWNLPSTSDSDGNSAKSDPRNCCCRFYYRSTTRAPPLHAAVHADSVILVRLLLAAGADPFATMGEDRWTPLHIAALYKRPKCAQIALFLLTAAALHARQTAPDRKRLAALMMMAGKTKVPLASGSRDGRSSQQQQQTPTHLVYDSDDSDISRSVSMESSRSYSYSYSDEEESGEKETDKNILPPLRKSFQAVPIQLLFRATIESTRLANQKTSPDNLSLSPLRIACMYVDRVDRISGGSFEECRDEDQVENYFTEEEEDNGSDTAARRRQYCLTMKGRAEAALSLVKVLVSFGADVHAREDKFVFRYPPLHGQEDDPVRTVTLGGWSLLSVAKLYDNYRLWLFLKACGCSEKAAGEEARPDMTEHERGEEYELPDDLYDKNRRLRLSGRKRAREEDLMNHYFAYGNAYCDDTGSEREYTSSSSKFINVMPRGRRNLYDEVHYW